LKPEGDFLRATLKQFLNIQVAQTDENDIDFDHIMKIIADTDERKL
jgi:hypothetical protein